jgi:tRNA threonylcarbamoyladenosine modification (KEOPS) complex  Pcc1 subunit
VNGVRAGWTASITVSVRDPAFSEHLERALGPEAAREVPRSTARVHREAPDRLVIDVSARDSGAMRAALNTYLGWVALSTAAARLARERRSPASADSRSA